MGIQVNRDPQAETEPTYDAIAARVSSLGFVKLRELSRDYREHGCKWGIVPYGGFRAWLAETVDRQNEEELAKSRADSGEYFGG